MTGSAWATVAIFVGAYVLIATERIHRVAAALGGAAIMLLIGATDAQHAFFSEDSGIDWNVLFLLIGMMLIVASAGQGRRGDGAARAGCHQGCAAARHRFDALS